MTKNKIVYYPGVWDLFHSGHVNALRVASRDGTRDLIVGVPTDDVVFQDKGEKPILTCQERLTIVESIRYVAQAIIYSDLSFISELMAYSPDYLAVGSYWGESSRHKEAEYWIKINRRSLLRIPYTTDISSSEIKERIQNERRTSYRTNGPSRSAPSR